MPTAYVLINCDLESESKIIEDLKRLPEVVEVFNVLGSYDIIAKVAADSVEKFKEVIDLKIRMVKQVNATLTLITNEEESYKSSYLLTF
jgi:DNA-binding Lrp family transcriptional regulator